MAHQPTPTIAFLGTGLMGEPMCHNLLKAGLPLTIWNRSADKTKRLAKRGAVWPRRNAVPAPSGRAARLLHGYHFLPWVPQYQASVSVSGSIGLKFLPYSSPNSGIKQENLRDNWNNNKIRFGFKTCKIFRKRGKTRGN